MVKRKQSAAQKRASLRNLKKARSALNKKKKKKTARRKTKRRAVRRKPARKKTVRRARRKTTAKKKRRSNPSIAPYVIVALVRQGKTGTRIGYFNGMRFSSSKKAAAKFPDKEGAKGAARKCNRRCAVVGSRESAQTIRLFLSGKR